MLVIDYETRSPTPISNGAYNYASDPQTEVICMGWRTEGMDTAEVWWPGDDIDTRLLARLKDANCRVYAHNANFDRNIYDFISAADHGFPSLSLDRWACSSAEARINGLNGRLDLAYKCAHNNPKLLGKDLRGTQLIKELSIPPYNQDPALLVEMGEYCARDVDITWELIMLMPESSDTLMADYLVNERINDRGIKVDMHLAELATRYASAEIGEISAALDTLTAGVITKPTQTARLRQWVEDKADRKIISLMTTTKDGKRKLSLDKSIRANILAYDDEENALDATTRNILELYDAASASSVSKFVRMAAMADPVDHRVRGAFIFAGAGQTLRYSSKGCQLHNFRRECFKPEEAEQIKWGMAEDLGITSTGHNVMQTLAKLLRPTLIPDTDKLLVISDWAAIEARVLPWLTASPLADGVLDIFRDDGDVYIVTAAGIYSTSPEKINDQQRQVGKVAVLSLGFGGAAGAFNAMARNYGVYMTEDEITAVVHGWRSSNPWAPQYWGQLNDAFATAWENNTSVIAGRVTYMREGSSMLAYLPCGTVLTYPHVKRDREGFSFAKSAWTPAADAKEWPRNRVWHGILAENITQATAASLLRWALAECERQNLTVVAHTHDEIILESPADSATEAQDKLLAIMCSGPLWAAGLPLNASADIKKRYGK